MLFDVMKGKVLGRKRLEEVGPLFTPDTILRWHRMLVAKKWDYSDRRRKAPGRPTLSDEIRRLVVRMAHENPSWGDDRIAGAMQNLGHDVSDQSVGNILKAHGIEPAPNRKRQTTWKTFLKAHWDVLAAIDFTTVEVWTKGGLRRQLASRFTRAFAPRAVTEGVPVLPQCRSYT